MLTLNSPIRTPYHSIPAGYKVGFLMIFSLVMYLIHSPLLMLYGFAFVIVAKLIVGIRFFIFALWKLLPIYPFLIVILLWHLLTNTFNEGLVIGLRLLAVFGLANLVTMTTRLDDMINLLNRVLKPFAKLGLDLSIVSVTIGLAIRTIPKIIDIVKKIGFSWRSRSVKPINWRMVFPLVCLTLDDSEHVAEAIKARRAHN
ncbi:MAG: energy-coupling factor transporter transmembrane component T [Rhodobacteraceae bacterium]|nr:energy-coupling factor transporter transmembrane component T [Paracoccaceae bacterium]